VASGPVLPTTIDAGTDQAMRAEEKPVWLEEDGTVARLVLTHPPLNALSASLVDALDGAVRHLAAHPELKVVHLRSNQRVFSAGGDLKFIGSVMESPTPGHLMRAYVDRIQQLFQRFETLPAITVCQLDGPAYGGGLELALACDFRIASDRSSFGLPEVGLGLLPAAGGTQRLTRLVGACAARRVILLGETLNASAARDIGLIDQVLPADQCANGVQTMIDTMRGKPRMALLAAKACMAEAFDISGRGFQAEAERIAELVESAETRALVTSFLQASARRG
jgi:enoyl-CoA hydratase/carnithine racemase